MNIKLKHLFAFSLVLFLGTTFAQEPKVKKVSFLTSAVCGECKERIEDKLNYTKGIIYAELDVDSKILTVKFKTKALNSMQIKGIISSIGYDAGEVPRNQKAFKDLPKCCRSEGHCER